MDDNAKAYIKAHAKLATIEVALAKLISEKLLEGPHPKKACAEWFEPIQSAHLRYLEQPSETLDRVMSQAYVDASTSLRELTDSMLD